MTDRRSFLKFFGAGAIIAPVVAGAPLLSEGHARIIEPPKIEILPPSTGIVPSLPPNEILSVDVVCRTAGGATYTIAAKGIAIESQLPREEITTMRGYSSAHREFAFSGFETTIRVVGDPPLFVGTRE